MLKPLQIRRIDSRTQDLHKELDTLRDRLSPSGNVVSEASRQRTIDVFGQPLSPQQVVETICDHVRREGLTAVLDYCRKLDRADLNEQSVRVSADEIRRAHAQANPEFLQTVRRIRDNIREFQRAIVAPDIELRRPDGTKVSQRYLPLERIGVCVPGGAAAYPSTVLMTVVPAQVAGVREIVVVAPPTPFGAYNRDVLAVCGELEVAEVYRVGGAHAVAALAYGAGPIAKVDKIVGPGNLFVALAKKFVFGQVDIDSIAGPSEVVVIADQTTRPDFAAADMLAQAEHSPGASILVTWKSDVLDAVELELRRQVQGLSRSELTIQSLADFGALILVSNEVEACQVTNLIAPEHLHIAIDEAGRLLPQIRNAGAIFLGNHSPVALGDYIAGPSHVLPTGGTARWASGLTANDFRRSGSIIEYTKSALQQTAAHVSRMADIEGLTAHKASIEIRLD